ncbi:MAG: 50S ribosomal protein L24 [Gammaproteobacteria bacterium]
MKKIRKGDDVVILSGRSKSARGKVLRVMEDDRVVVEGVNMVKRHTRPNPQMGQPGGIVEKEAPIHVSNVAIFNAATGKADRVGFKTLGDGRKVRIFKSSGEAVDI